MNIDDDLLFNDQGYPGFPETLPIDPPDIFPPF